MAQLYSGGGDSRFGAVPPSTGGSSTFAGNARSPGRISESRVHVGETIKDIAARLLGDRGRWHELVLLNDLRAPYISATGGDNVLAYGSFVLFPSTTGEGIPANQVNHQNQTLREKSDSSNTRDGAVAEAYGRDIRLGTKDSAGEYERTDVVVSDSGDFSTITGIPNVEQAVRLKFATEQGELPAHPRYGSRFPVGSKASRASVTEYQLDVKNTILSDKRVASIVDLDLVAVGDAVSVQARLRLVNEVELLTTNFALRVL
jgi:hypothetical protein